MPVRIVHALPGRVRLIYPSSTFGLSLARRLALHRQVSEVRCVLTARSLTVRFDQAAEFHDILAELPDEATLGAPVWIVDSARMGVGRVALVALDLISGNLLGLAQAALGLLPGRVALIG